MAIATQALQMGGRLPGGDRGLGPAPEMASFEVLLADVERGYILRIVESCGWGVRGPGSAVALRGLNGSTPRSRMKKPGIRAGPCFDS